MTTLVYGVATYSDLKAISYSSLSPGVVAEVQERTTSNVGGGTFVWNKTDMSAIIAHSAVTATSVDTSTDTFTVTGGHGLDNGWPVLASATADLNDTTVYYVHYGSATDFQLYDTPAHACAGGSTGLQNITVTTLPTFRQHADPDEGIFVIPTGAAVDGSDGAWVRRIDGTRISDQWFGFDWTNADIDQNDEAIASLFAVARALGDQTTYQLHPVAFRCFALTLSATIVPGGKCDINFGTVQFTFASSGGYVPMLNRDLTQATLQVRDVTVDIKICFDTKDTKRSVYGGRPIFTTDTVVSVDHTIGNGMVPIGTSRYGSRLGSGNHSVWDGIEITKFSCGLFQPSNTAGEHLQSVTWLTGTSFSACLMESCDYGIYAAPGGNFLDEVFFDTLRIYICGVANAHIESTQLNYGYFYCSGLTDNQAESVTASVSGGITTLSGIGNFENGDVICIVGAGIGATVHVTDITSGEPTTMPTLRIPPPTDITNAAVYRNPPIGVYINNGGINGHLFIEYIMNYAIYMNSQSAVLGRLQISSGGLSSRQGAALVIENIYGTVDITLMPSSIPQSDVLNSVIYLPLISSGGVNAARNVTLRMAKPPSTYGFSPVTWGVSPGGHFTAVTGAVSDNAVAIAGSDNFYYYPCAGSNRIEGLNATVLQNLNATAGSEESAQQLDFPAYAPGLYARIQYSAFGIFHKETTPSVCYISVKYGQTSGGIAGAQEIGRIDLSSASCGERWRIEGFISPRATAAQNCDFVSEHWAGSGGPVTRAGTQTRIMSIDFSAPTSFWLVYALDGTSNYFVLEQVNVNVSQPVVEAV